MAISNSLAKKVEADVKGTQELAVETQVKDALSEIKNKLKYTESYLSTLYDSGFKAYLKSRTFDRPENLPKEIIAINNIKQRIIKQGLEAKKSTEHPSSFGPYLYWIGGISKDIHNNNTVQNVIKGVIDEVMAIPDMLIQIAKNPLAFGKALYKLIKNPGDLRKGLKQAYGDAFTQFRMNTPEQAYRWGRSSTLIILTFFPGGAAKFGLNLTRGARRTVSKQATRISTKVGLKTPSKEVSKSVAKKTEKGLKNSEGGRTMYREMNGGAKNYAQRQVGKDAGKISKESQTATKANRVAEMNTKGFYGKRADKLRNLLRYGDKAPVIKQINNIGRWTFRNLDKGTEAIVKKIHPKFYEKLTQQQNRLSAIKNQAEGWAKKLKEHPNEVQKITKEIEKQKDKINEINNRIATKQQGRGLDKSKNLIEAQEKLQRLENNLANLKKQEGILKSKLKGANEAYLVHQSILEGMNDAQRAGKLAVWIETQQVVSVLDRSQIATLDREIAETVTKIKEISDDLEEGMKEIDDLLKEYEGTADGLESGQTEFSDGSISIDLPEGVNLSEVDTSKYKIIITGMASKTGSESVNRRIAQQRAENAKKMLIEKYGIKDEGQIDIQIDLQSEHPDKLGEDLSKWQGARIKLEPVTNSKKPTAKNGILDENNLDESLFKNWTE